MATWVTHLRIADAILEQYPNLDRRGFCVGNIAPDCNVENEDWTAFTPSREITHWMRGDRKAAADCDAFCESYILSRLDEIKTSEHYAFLLGYYAHLITDASFQSFIRNEDRVRAAWNRLMSNETLSHQSAGMEHTWDNVKKLIPKRVWMSQIYRLEGAYLANHPDSGYFTEILPLKEFPDYIDYLPKGCIVRKIGIMGYVPKDTGPEEKYIAISREEYEDFVDRTIALASAKFRDKRLPGIL